ncbi:GntR family transcriptional regulator [Roseibium sp.]|uniref:GntR family transcriptional regulator n=1 Tax=Roseibium sp. TaxID=1936156 RepID=UPI003A97293E
MDVLVNDAGGDLAARLEGAANAQERFEIMYSTLRDRICMLVYPPGTLLGEEALAAEFGVSRSPLRKVLKILESDGLLQSQQGVGTLVTDVDLEALSQVYQLRMELNEMVGRIMPVVPDQAVMSRFADMAERAESLRRKPDLHQFARLNIDFFHVFQSLTDNLPLRDVSERLFYQTCRIWLKLVPSMDLADEVDIFASEIRDIEKAVRLKDVSGAALIRRAHLSMGYARLNLSCEVQQ